MRQTAHRGDRGGRCRMNDVAGRLLNNDWPLTLALQIAKRYELNLLKLLASLGGAQLNGRPAGGESLHHKLTGHNCAALR